MEIINSFINRKTNNNKKTSTIQLFSSLTLNQHLLFNSTFSPLPEMSSKFLSSFNDSTALPPLNSTNDPFSDKVTNCLSTASSFFSFGILVIILLLPLCIFILLDGLQRWWQGCRSSSFSSFSVSHSDCIAYHMMAMELIGILGWSLMAHDFYNNETQLLRAGIQMVTFTMYGEMCFLNLICAERHLAVVHPIMYRSLREARLVRIRNVTMLMVWLLCVVVTYLTALYPIFMILGLSVLSLLFISYFSMSVLCFLIGPGPGKQGRDSDRLRHTQAFYSILTTLLALLSRFCCSIASALVSVRQLDSCLIWNLELWASLPSSLLIPIMFLLRTQSPCAVRRATNKDRSNQQQ